MRLSRTIPAALTALALSTALAPTAAAADLPAAPGDTVTLPLRKAIAALDTRAEKRTGYERTKFKHWIDEDRDGCTTRNEVLLAEAVTAPEEGARCKLSGGTWHSAYDDTTITGPGGLDIDHFVPLAEAWDSGASEWSAKDRERYANDLGDDRSLIAVSAKTNRSKADQDPATWMPPAASYRCTYVTTWTTVKTRWGLSADTSEKATLERVAGDCPNVPIKVELAR
ncbi:putative secreted protein (plasmid) [Streptomyces sp. Tu6071]|uniref:HNH endonuclease family protein n=1 Tax=Streptomyces sp. Tu6071 TaxID=355249 RepID=UPI00020E6A45|nr:HNH endonuclease family protein [Streptomyces sp. Tu6071]EGJ72661.1 putative secreted protein [Streptomyces sp. Tu6071]